MSYDNWLCQPYDDQCEANRFEEYLESEGITLEEWVEREMKEQTGDDYDGF